MNYYFYFIAQLIKIVIWLIFLDYLHKISQRCKKLFCKLGWFSSRREINLYEVIYSTKKDGKNLKEEVSNALSKGKVCRYLGSRDIELSAADIQSGIQDWYIKVCKLIPRIHRCHDVYLPQPLWDEIFKRYTYSYDNIMAIRVSTGGKPTGKNNSNDDSDSDRDDSSDEDEDENEVW